MARVAGRGSRSRRLKHGTTGAIRRLKSPPASRPRSCSAAHHPPGCDRWRGLLKLPWRKAQPVLGTWVAWSWVANTRPWAKAVATISRSEPAERLLGQPPASARTGMGDRETVVPRHGPSALPRGSWPRGGGCRSLSGDPAHAVPRAGAARNPAATTARHGCPAEPSPQGIEGLGLQHGVFGLGVEHTGSAQSRPVLQVAGGSHGIFKA